MLQQTKDSYKALIASGLNRGEFSVQTERRTFRHQGRRCTEYGQAIIALLVRKERALELIPAFLENGLDVTIYLLKRGPSYPRVRLSINETGKYNEIDLRKEQ